MDVDQTQELEIEALKAIYGDDFQDAPPSKVWKVRDLLVSPFMPPQATSYNSSLSVSNERL
jgi:hypothetical protein